MYNYQRMTIIISITILITLKQCAPTSSKSLAPIWLSDDKLVNNHRENNELSNEKLPDTSMNTFIKSNAPTVRRMSNSPIKKKSYLGREWSTGNLPFSILYVNTQRATSQSISDLNKLKDMKRPVESIATTTKAQNRSTMRNKNAGQSRRQYSIIPELFMSYSWDQLGK